MCCVRPGFLEANASCFCCVKTLMQVDLPALERPTKAISGTSRGGKKCSSGAVVKNRAVCSQPVATTLAVGGGLAAPAGLPVAFAVLLAVAFAAVAGRAAERWTVRVGGGLEGLGMAKTGGPTGTSRAAIVESRGFASLSGCRFDGPVAYIEQTQLTELT